MPRVQASIDIEAPIDHVFAAVTDPKRIPEWTTTVIEVRDVSDYPVGEGTTWNQVTLVNNRSVNLVCRVAQFEPPHQGELEVSGEYSARIWTRCEPTETGTRVTQDVDFVAPGGILGRVAGGLIGPLLKRELTHTMERQREILEREAEEVAGTESRATGIEAEEADGSPAS